MRSCQLGDRGFGKLGNIARLWQLDLVESYLALLEACNLSVNHTVRKFTNKFKILF